MIRASAPGKIILLGEHAVVYGQPALAVPVLQVEAKALVEESTLEGVWIEAPQVRLFGELEQFAVDEPLAAAARTVLAHFSLSAQQLRPGIRIRIQSSIPVASGLGSGAAVSVALIRALSAYLGQPLADEQVNAMAYEIEKLHHGTPSGIDNTVITYARPVYFVRGQPPQTFRVGGEFTFLIGDSGIEAPTKVTVAEVRRLWEADRPRLEAIFARIGEIVRQGRAALEEGKAKQLGELMNANQALLRELTVSSAELERLVEAARAAGALGAKLSGGGRGGNVIALVPPERTEEVFYALLNAGARQVIFTELHPTEGGQNEHAVA